MIRPDYSGGGIANLMRTLADACGAPPPPQVPLAARYGLAAATLAEARNIVLVVVDGLGAQRLETCGSGVLRTHAGPPLASVFPSTTAAAIPTFMTGLPPAQHALTGWHMWFDELQAVAAVLPLKPRAGKAFAEPPAEIAARLFAHRPLYAGMNRPAWIVSPADIAFSPFNVFHSRGATTCAYADLAAFTQTLAGLVRAPGRKYIYAYWPQLDSVSHHHGSDSKEARAALAAFCLAFDALVADLAGSDTVFLVTADHGFIDSPPARVVQLEDHPGLAATLARPLCGEQRLAWCYLKAGAAGAFTDYVRRHLDAVAEAVPSAQLIADGWFGPAPVHPRLAARVGDYALLLRENWTIKDWLPGERRYTLLGVHGGTSADEMMVPLSVIRC